MKDSQKDLKDWRINKVLELSAKGLNQAAIAKELQVSEPTISRDIAYLRAQSKENIRHYIDEELPLEYNKTLAGLNSILKEAWSAADKAHNERDRYMHLTLAKECYSMKLDLLSSATVIDRAVRFVTLQQHRGLTVQNDKEAISTNDA